MARKGHLFTPVVQNKTGYTVPAFTELTVGKGDKYKKNTCVIDDMNGRDLGDKKGIRNGVHTYQESLRKEEGIPSRENSTRKDPVAGMH